MENNLIILVMFSIGILLILRGYMSVGSRACQTKKNWKLYVANVSIVDRWFFWTAPKIMKDKYSKSEKKIIRYSSIAKAYQAINLAIHMALAIELVFAFCYALDFVGEYFFNRVCIAYFATAFLLFVILAIIELKTNGRYHRSRYGS